MEEWYRYKVEVPGVPGKLRVPKGHSIEHQNLNKRECFFLTKEGVALLF